MHLTTDEEKYKKKGKYRKIKENEKHILVKTKGPITITSSSLALLKNNLERKLQAHTGVKHGNHVNQSQ